MTDAAHSPLLAAHGLGVRPQRGAGVRPAGFRRRCRRGAAGQGGNGSGKTTLLRVLAGLLRADSGRIEIEGRPAAPALRAHAIAYLGHLPALKGELSVLENLEFLCGLHGRRPRQTPGDALAIVGMGGYEDAPARQLSAGQKKRVTLARMWLAPAPLWLLDEPYANLDLEGINLVNRMISAHLRDGGATLW